MLKNIVSAGDDALKVVDGNGVPRVGCHGTDGSFHVFWRDFLGQNTDTNASDENFAKTAHLGFWFNSDRIPHSRYHKAVFLNLREPLEFSDLERYAYHFDYHKDAKSFIESVIRGDGGQRGNPHQ